MLPVVSVDRETPIASMLTGDMAISAARGKCATTVEMALPCRQEPRMCRAPSATGLIPTTDKIRRKTSLNVEPPAMSKNGTSMRSIRGEARFDDWAEEVVSDLRRVHERSECTL
jgi:hypothetical protein